MRSRSSTRRHSPSGAAPKARQLLEASQEKMSAARALAEEFRKTQLQLAENRKLPAGLADFGAAQACPVPLALLSRGGTVLSGTASFFALFDVSPDELRYRPLSDFLQPHDVSDFFKFLGHCAGSHETCRAQFRMAASGKREKDILLIINSTQLAEPNQVVFRAAFFDLNDGDSDFGARPAAQNSRLIAAIDGIIWEADYPERFTFISPHVQTILGFSPHQWMQDPAFWERHIHRDDRDRVVQARSEASRKPAAHVLEYRMITADRRTIWVKDSAMVLAASPKWARMCGIITDVTDLQNAREDLRRANDNLESAVADRTAKMEQSLDAMETLCYGIAHDLKAPLRGLQGFIGILMSDYNEVFDKDAKMYAQRCQLAVQRMGELIEAVLMYGRLNHTLPELLPIRLKALVDRVLTTMEPEITAKNAKVQVQMTMPSITGNPFLLEQVFTNLITNALKFSRPDIRPEIAISAIQTEDTQVGQGVPAEPHPSGRFVRVTVTDNGIGVAPEFTKRMFGMFQKLHRGDEYPGTGIGLAVVKRAVELMNGRLGVFSHLNQGSSFWIELPAA